ncbi:hypothetical protein DRN85_09245 [Methanosarcinales archaeon]|nr:MAG: hypothetical protein DRN85_09245 [Methanosarcinales archaeon]
MTWRIGQTSVWQVARSDYLKLLPILGLAFYMAFIPHLNYPYPVHIDEWVHLAYSKALMRAGSATFPDPFSGEGVLGLSTNLEAGFHLFWGVFQRISGISWLTIFRYFPSVIFMITVLSVYVMARREGYGWEAALFTCLIPTTVGVLGPAFMVPLAMGLMFIPLCLYLVFNFRTVWSYLVLFILTCFLLSIHAATAVGLVIILAPYILLNLKGNFRHSLGVTLAIAIPFLAPFPWIFGMLLPTAKSLLSPQPLPTYVDIPKVTQDYGYLPIALGLLGTFLLAMRGGMRNYGLVSGLLALLVMLVTFFTFHYGVPIMYERGLMYMMVMLSIITGAGLAGVRTVRLPGQFAGRIQSFVVNNAGNILCLILVVVTLTMIIPDRQHASYYLMIDKEDYEAFAWVRDNVGGNYEKAILDPWKATPFVAITGKYVYTRIHAYPRARDRRAYEFLESGCVDTAFLKENGISIIYSRGGCNNPDLVEVRKDVYLLGDIGS